MDSLGNIAIFAVNGGTSPYSYLVGSSLQQDPIFANQYPDGSYLLGVKDLSGCMSVKVIPLHRISGCGAVTDIDGNSYNSVTIGTQCWMQSNLNVSKYRNGDIIPQVTDQTEWQNLTTGAWCYYENNSANGPVYGKLYNWYAVNDPRGIAPTGYHVASKQEWDDLITYLGGVGPAAAKLKSTTGWTVVPNIVVTNSSGFTGLATGLRDINFGGVHDYANWWSTSQGISGGGWSIFIYAYQDSVQSSDWASWDGESVRCIKD